MASNSPDPNAKSDQNVVDIGARAGEAEPGQIGGLLLTIREMTLKAASAWVATLLDSVDDILFDLAEKADTNASQTDYFSGMRETRRKRPRIERLFGEHVARGFVDFATVQSSQRKAAQRAMRDNRELSLVDDNELEESLAVSSMVAKADGRLSATLDALNQRLAILSGGRAVSNGENPLAPYALADAFREALGELSDVDIRVHLIILKLFERFVLNELGTLYHDVNVKLVQAGVLPHLRHPTVNRHQGASGGPRAAGYQGQAIPGGEVDDARAATYAGADSDDLHAELMQRLTSLLASRRHIHQPEVRGDGPYPGGGADASLTPVALLSALTLLQAQAEPLPAMPAATDTTSAIAMAQHVKDELLGQVQRLSGQAKANVSGSDEDTIDLVGMLFEYILQDRAIPTPMRVLLARLQIPYLKVAILNRRMFAHSSHPARRLLDQLADAAKGWSEESDRDHRLYEKVKGVVETLLQDFDDDIGVFEHQLEEFGGFTEHNRKRAELAETRAAEAVRGRERLQEARHRAAREILPRLERRELPPLMRGVLTRPWANYLVLVALRQGADSPEYGAAVQFVDDFLATTEVPQCDPDRAQYRDALTTLETRLRTGLTTVAFHETDIEHLLAALRKFWQQQLGEATPAPGPEADANPEALLGADPDTQPAIVDATAGTEGDSDPEEVTADVDARSIRAVRNLAVGAWIEFTDTAGNRQRAKLSWISPISGKYLFVNRRGLKVLDRSVTALANEVHNQRALILEDTPLFDRALDAIVDRLRRPPEERVAPATE